MPAPPKCFGTTKNPAPRKKRKPKEIMRNGPCVSVTECQHAWCAGYRTGFEDGENHVYEINASLNETR